MKKYTRSRLFINKDGAILEEPQASLPHHTACPINGHKLLMQLELTGLEHRFFHYLCIISRRGNDLPLSVTKAAKTIGCHRRSIYKLIEKFKMLDLMRGSHTNYMLNPDLSFNGGNVMYRDAKIRYCGISRAKIEVVKCAPIEGTKVPQARAHLDS